MDRFSFIGGAYAARSGIAAATRSVNYYPEPNPKDSPSPMTLYQRPGLRQQIAAPEVAPCRMLYRPSNGIGGYTVIGTKLYYIGTDWSLTELGSLSNGRTNPCSMIDNGTTGLVVDGSVSTPVAGGWTVDIATHGSFAQITDVTGTFTGADRVDTLDTFVLWNIPGTRGYGSTLSGSITFDALYTASKAAYPDFLQTLFVNRREILLLGNLKSEVWYDAGNANFPFAELPGAYIEHGCGAKYSVAANDISVFWLGMDLAGGQAFVFRQRGYDTKVISNPALSYAIEQMSASGTIADAIGYCYSVQGHSFYVLTFPTGNQTWVFDDLVADPMEAWHQRAWTDANGVLHRDRSNCFAFINGTHCVGDWENGTIYALDPNYYYDQVAGVEGPIQCIRSFAHLMVGRDPVTKQAIPSNGLPIQHNAFWADLEAGTDITQDVSKNLSLRWSDDRGKTWSNAVLTSAGALGQYKTVPQWTGLGLAYDRIYELSHSIPAQVAVNGAWIRGQVERGNLG